MTPRLTVILLALGVLGSACAPGRRPGAVPPSPPRTPVTAPERPRAPRPPEARPTRHRQRGKASWYGARFQGRRTASGERFDMRKLTAAHRTLPFGTKVRVTDVKTGRVVIVRINDRGPYGKGRVIDLSRAAAERLGIIRRGIAAVELEVLERGDGRTYHRRRR